MAIKKTKTTKTTKRTIKRSAGPQPGDYVIVRTYSAGVHAGVLESRSGKECVLSDSRQIWQWSGALTTKELAARGPTGGKISAESDGTLLTEVIAIERSNTAVRERLARLETRT